MTCVWVILLPESAEISLSPGRCQTELSICPQSGSLYIFLRMFYIVFISKSALIFLISSYGSSGCVFCHVWVTSINIKVLGRVNIHYISDYILGKEMGGYVCLGDKASIVLEGIKSRAVTIISIGKTSVYGKGLASHWQMKQKQLHWRRNLPQI